MQSNENYMKKKRFVYLFFFKKCNFFNLFSDICII